MEVRLLLIPLGFAVIAVTLADVVLTTLVLQGGGPVTGRLGDRLWRLGLRLNHGRLGPSMLSYAGVLIMLAIILLWVLFFFLGWNLIFFAEDRAVLTSETRLPADFSSRFYFVGYTIVTLGMGDYIPGPGVWQVLTAIASASGYALLGLSVSYLLPTISAAVSKRRLAGEIAGLGRTPDEILINMWNGRDFKDLQHHLSSLGSGVLSLSENYLAYPVLHYFHSNTPESAAPVCLAALDEALTILEYAVPETLRLDRSSFVPARGSFTSLLNSLSTAYIRAEKPPPLPNLEELRQLGLPLCSDEEFLARTGHLLGRRRLLLALVENDGWSWELLTRPLAALPVREGTNRLGDGPDAGL